MKKLVLAVCLLAACFSTLGQGIVKFLNSSTSLISVQGQVMPPPPATYYFALLMAPAGTTDRSQFVFTGCYATNYLTAGRIFGGAAATVLGWPAGETRSYMVYGWSADMGHDWNPQWLQGIFPVAGYFGSSTIATGTAGGVDITGATLPPMYVFSSSGISSGFTLLGGWNPPVQLWINPPNLSVLAGDTATFSWGGTMLFSSFQWQFNGADIIGAIHPNLILVNVQPSQAGRYSLIASGPGVPPQTASANLTVISAPIILAFPQSQAVDVGAACSFSVTATGAPPLAYQWYFNNAAIPGAANSTLTITHAQLSDSGAYAVEISNSFGVLRSPPAVLTVVAEAPAIVSQPLSQTVIVGGDTRFSVTATGSMPLTYHWLLNGLPLSNAFASELLLTGVQPSQSGAYSVVVTNGFGAVTSQVAILSVVPPPVYTVLHNFTRNDGASPRGKLVSSAEKLYGTTQFSDNSGIVFSIGFDGSDFAVLHTFTGPDGAFPKGALLLSGQTLYGTTEVGGRAGDPGTVFKINTDGTGFVTLKDFADGEGRWPNGDLVLAGTTLYGTTSVGGFGGCGTVFKINTDGTGFAVLHSFAGYPADGYGPDGGLTLVGTTLYGATPRGGQYGPPTGWPDAGYGTLFQLEIDGSGYALLKQFSGPDLKAPYGGMVISGDTLYGITEGGSSAGDDGSVFRINTDGTAFDVLHHFAGASGDGALPYGGLELSGSILYGTTVGGGRKDPSGETCGVVFKVNTDGSGYLVLKEFARSDGAHPYSGLLLEGSTLYGTTSSGGVSNNGVLFTLSLPASKIFISPVDQTAEIGSNVIFRARAVNGPLTYRWFFEGSNPITVANTNSSLILTNVQPAQAGTYSVVVSNAFGLISNASARLSVIPAVERRNVPALFFELQPPTTLTVDYTDSLDPPSWLLFPAIFLTNSQYAFLDLSSPLPARRFYRASLTGVPPNPDLHMVPAITLSGSIGASVRVDYINQFGPIDAWTNLSTVTLSNTSQLFFDLSATNQVPRLYRLLH